MSLCCIRPYIHNLRVIKRVNRLWNLLRYKPRPHPFWLHEWYKKRQSRRCHQVAPIEVKEGFWPQQKAIKTIEKNQIQVHLEEIVEPVHNLIVELFSCWALVDAESLGFSKEVVSIKKVINRKPKSTIGVMSILTDIFLERAFLPFGAWSDADISAIFLLFSCELWLSELWFLSPIFTTHSITHSQIELV